MENNFNNNINGEPVKIDKKVMETNAATQTEKIKMFDRALGNVDKPANFVMILIKAFIMLIFAFLIACNPVVQ
jgi:hypothetical protein